MVDGDPDLLHPGEHVDQRQLDAGQQTRAATVSELVVERRREVEHGAGVQHRGLAAGLVVDPVEAELAVVGDALLELALEVAHGEVGEVVGPLVGPRQVGRERRVALQPGQRPATGGEREHRALGVVQHLGLVGVADPRHERGVVLGRDALHRHVGGGALRRWPTPARARRRCPSRHVPSTCTPTRSPLLAWAASQSPTWPGSSRVISSAKPGLVDLLLRLEGLEETVAQHPELQAVEERVHLLAVPGLHREVGGRRAAGPGRRPGR